MNRTKETQVISITFVNKINENARSSNQSNFFFWRRQYFYLSLIDKKEEEKARHTESLILIWARHHRHHALLLFLILSSFYGLFLSTSVIVYCLIFSLMKNRTINSAFFKFRSSYLWMCGTFNHCNFSRFKIFYLFFERLFTILFYQRVRLCGITTFTSKRVTVSVWPW